MKEAGVQQIVRDKTNRTITLLGWLMDDVRDEQTTGIYQVNETVTVEVSGTWFVPRGKTWSSCLRDRSLKAWGWNRSQIRFHWELHVGAYRGRTTNALKFIAATARAIAPLVRPKSAPICRSICPCLARSWPSGELFSLRSWMPSSLERNDAS